MGVIMVDINKDPNYKVLELQAENENLKDKIIKLQREKIEELEKQLVEFRNRGIIYTQEKDVGSNMIASTEVPSRKILRTISEISQELEKRSIFGNNNNNKEKENSNV
jgi:hypothetical protein